MYEITYLSIEENHEYEEIIRNVIKECYKEENLENSKLTVQITLTNPENIRKYNKEYRNIDKETDVISFAHEDEKSFPINEFRVLGDIYISIDKAISQKDEYGHSLERELCFLVTHGLLHLLGYDHMNKEDEEEMFKLQEELLDSYGIKR